MKKLFVSIESDKKIKSLASDSRISISIQSQRNGKSYEHKKIQIVWDEKTQKAKLI